jgi:hypothetical protein
MDRLSVFVVKRMLPCQHTSARVSILRICCYYVWWSFSFCGKTDAPLVSSPTHTNVSKRQQTSAYVGIPVIISHTSTPRAHQSTSCPYSFPDSCSGAIRQHTSEYVSIRRNTSATSSYVRAPIRQHTSEYVIIRQHTSAHLIPVFFTRQLLRRQHTSAYTSAYVRGKSFAVQWHIFCGTLVHISQTCSGAI